MIEVKAPNPISIYEDRVIFMAGSIEMGTAENWQTRFIDYLDHTDYVLLNPRRDDWDASWVQSIDNPQFNEQVTWELTGLEKADIIVFYFDPNTKSPITLMELGIACQWAEIKSIYVVCPQGFWRKGNVDILCERYGFTQFHNIDDLTLHLEIMDL